MVWVTELSATTVTAPARASTGRAVLGAGASATHAVASPRTARLRWGPRLAEPRIQHSNGAPRAPKPNHAVAIPKLASSWPHASRVSGRSATAEAEATTLTSHATPSAPRTAGLLADARIMPATVAPDRWTAEGLGSRTPAARTSASATRLIAAGSTHGLVPGASSSPPTA